jgi:hypothetical protein
MKKKDYKKEIHELFEKEYKKITVKSEFDIRRLGWLEDEEIELLKKNSHAALNEALDYLGLKKKVYLLPLSGKKYTVYPSGKIKSEDIPMDATIIDIQNT